MARRSTRPEAAVIGAARIDRRTKDLIKRLHPGDVAVINHRDLDRVAADGLVEARVAAVVNAGESISGRYPNGGPIRVVQAGIRTGDPVRTCSTACARASSFVSRAPRSGVATS